MRPVRQRPIAALLVQCMVWVSTGPPASEGTAMTANGNLTTADRNVLGGALSVCSIRPLTGFYRTGCCETGPEDEGLHVVCAQVTAEFLAFSKAKGNDLSTPRPEYGFAGLRPGDRWCLCADRWKEALDAGVAPPIVLAATSQAALQVVSRADLLRYAIDIASNNG
jgi:uncharacterized protein